jgi:dienelactone hydrolase/streptogramin lyase
MLTRTRRKAMTRGRWDRSPLAVATSATRRALGVALLAAALASPAVALAGTDGLLSLAPIDGRTPVGLATSAIATDGRSVWVGYAGGVARVDAATGEVVLRAGTGVNGGVAADAHEVWISSYTHGVVVPLDPVSGSVDQARQASITEPAAMALGSGSLWVTSPTRGSVTRVDHATGEIAAIIPLAADGPIAAGLDAVWAASTGSGGLARIDPETNAVVPIDLELHPGDLVTAVSVGDEAVWVGTLKADLRRYDPATGEVTAIAAAAIPGLELEPIYGIAVSDEAAWLSGTAYTHRAEEYLLNPGTLVRLDTDDLAITDAWTLDAPGGNGAVLAGGALWIEVGAFDLQRMAVPDAPPAGPALEAGPLAAPFTFEIGIEYTRDAEGTGVPLDVLAPLHATGAPVVVLLPGGPGIFGQRQYLTGLAAALAERGALVLLTDYRNHVTGDTEAEARHDVSCAVAWAREHASEYGGEPSRVMVAGHSYGGYLLLHTALGGPDAATCDGAPAEPDVYIVMGKIRAEAPVPEQATTTVPLTLLIGSLDDEFWMARDFQDALVGAGFESTLVVADDVDHLGIIDTRETVPTVDTILALVAR